MKIKRGNQTKDIAPGQFAQYERLGWAEVAEAPAPMAADPTVEGEQFAELTAAEKKAKKAEVKLTSSDELNVLREQQTAKYGGGGTLPVDKYAEDDTLTVEIVEFAARRRSQGTGLSTRIYCKTEQGERIAVFPPQGGAFPPGLVVGDPLEIVVIDISNDDKPTLLANPAE